MENTGVVFLQVTLDQHEMFTTEEREEVLCSVRTQGQVCVCFCGSVGFFGGLPGEQTFSLFISTLYGFPFRPNTQSPPPSTPAASALWVTLLNAI